MQLGQAETTFRPCQKVAKVCNLHRWNTAKCRSLLKEWTNYISKVQNILRLLLLLATTKEILTREKGITGSAAIIGMVECKTIILGQKQIKVQIRKNSIIILNCITLYLS